MGKEECGWNNKTFIRRLTLQPVWPAGWLKKLFTRLGLIFAATLLLMQVVQIFLFAILQQKAPDFLNSVWGNWILAGVSMYVFCLPVYLLLMRRVPKQPLGQKRRSPAAKYLCCLSSA